MKNWKTTLKIALTVICLLVVIFHFIRHTDDLNKLRNLGVIHIGVIAILQLLYQFVFTSRSLLVVRKCSQGTISFWQWFRISAMGRFLSLFVPQVGNVYQGLRLKQWHQISFTQYATVKFSLAWIDFVFNMLFAAAVILCVDYSFWILKTPAPVFLVLLALLAASLPLILRWLVQAFPMRHRYVLWIKERLDELFQTTLTSVRDTAYLTQVVLQGVIVFSITCGVVYMCFSGLGAEPTIPAIVLFCALLKISDHAALTPGNLGIREVLFGLLGEFFGLGVSEGMLVSVIRRIVSQVEISIIAGIIHFYGLVSKEEKGSFLSRH